MSMGFAYLSSRIEGGLWRLVGPTWIDWMKSGLDELRAQRDLIDQLNVFPVPDGDTGHNMVATVEAALAALHNRSSDALSEVLQRMADGALIGGRGNSGVILSQLLAGFAAAGRDKIAFTPDDLHQAFGQAAITARRYVAQPVEGTILTMADALTQWTVRGDLVSCLTLAVRAGEEALEKTRDQLPQLKETDSVDAGALGYLCLVRGWLRAAQGRGEPTQHPIAPALSAGVEENVYHAGPLRYYYDVEALIYQLRSEDAYAVLERRLAEVGESVVLAPGHKVIKVHVHTDKPVELMEILTAVGDIRQMEWLDMRAQVASRAGSTTLLRIVADPSLHPVFEGFMPVVDAGLGTDAPDTLWVSPSQPLAVAVAVDSVGLAGQLCLEYVPGESWDVNRARLTSMLQRMRSWTVIRTRDGFLCQGRFYATPQAVHQAIRSDMAELGITTIYLSYRADREEANYWQEAFNAALVQCPLETPWMEIVWQP
ncbi:MAG: hypothetical protein C7B45_13275 [Sulfobacillus acidophilus]|uniref:DhaL domain-containing protein n=1 Tax=Sulfobacillus acidophilus TaxID=53633 RepID=A0A2T2WEW7_9FIRM|nr:MAG: hypothetical protein C7B45_13275 [Sulfobacillus acidophilus]